MSPKFLTTPSLAAALLIGNAPVVQATEASSGALGYTTITCNSGSDTRCSPAGITQNPEFVGKVSLAPSGSLVTISTATGWVDDDFNLTHYIQFIDGAKAGYWYSITDTTVDGGSGTTTLTVDLNGDSLTGIAVDDRIKIIRFWTLGTLLPLGDGVIHESLGTNPVFRKTLVFFPNLEADGTNIGIAGVYFRVASDKWYLDAGENVYTDADNVRILPDMFFWIRHKLGGTDTSFVPMGTIESGSVTMAVNRLTTGNQDTQLGLPRPVPVKLSELDLSGTDAFTSSAGTNAVFRKDLLFVYHGQPLVDGEGDIVDESTVDRVGYNQLAEIYYHDSASGNWRDAANDRIADGDYIMPGRGLMIRRKFSVDGYTEFWDNSPRF